MKQLSPEQRELVSSLTKRLGAIRGIRAVMLGGSHARGRALPWSDIDLSILYSEAAPFSIQSVRELADAANDTAGPVVTNFYEWGPWVNGGAWRFHCENLAGIANQSKLLRTTLPGRTIC